jgi:hypothetical protein
MEASERFWSKVAKNGPNDCWLWTSTKNQQGYGRFAFTVSKTPPRQKWHSAHRLVWEWENGPIPDDLIVCHHCDNPGCVNPRHLFIGTHRDNAQDRERKGRRCPAAGETNGRAKLTLADVIGIRQAANDTNRGELAERYRVSRGHVNAIISGRIWAHVA